MISPSPWKIGAIQSAPCDCLGDGTSSTDLLLITLGCAALAYLASIILPAIISQAQLSLAEDGKPVRYRDHPWVIFVAIAIGAFFLASAFLLAKVFPPADKPTALFLGASAGPVFSGIVNVPRFALHRVVGDE